MITMLDALDGLNKWKDRCTQTITDGFTRYSGGMTIEGIETIAKYYYYLGACNAFVIAEIKKSTIDTVHGIGAKQRWLRRPDNEL